MHNVCGYMNIKLTVQSPYHLRTLTTRVNKSQNTVTMIIKINVFFNNNGMRNTLKYALMLSHSIQVLVFVISNDVQISAWGSKNGISVTV